MIKKLQMVILTTSLILSNLTSTVCAAMLKDDERKIYVLSECVQSSEDTLKLEKKSHEYLKSKVVDTEVIKDKKYEAAYNNVKKTYDYFKNNFGIKGIDGNGFVPYIFPNALIANSTMSPRSKPMILLGSPESYIGVSGGKSYAYATDVVAHEYTHGVLLYNYKLSPNGEGRSIHEGLSDYFGSIVEGKNWTMGENKLATDMYVRDIKSPNTVYINQKSYIDISNLGKIVLGNSYKAADGTNRRVYPIHYSQRSLGSSEKSGYINSTIISHLMYLIANGDGATFKGIGNVSAGKLAFSAIGFLTDLTVDGLRHVTIETFADAMMRKVSSSQKDTVTNAFKKVGLSDVRDIDINKTSSTLKKGQSLKLSATIEPSYAHNKGVTWKSSNTNVAKVDQNGNVKAIKTGTSIITVTTKDGNMVASCKVKVNTPVTSVKLNKTSISLVKGRSQKLTATINPTDADTKTVTWKSSNNNVATVDKNGNVKAVAPGTANITVTTKDGNKKATCTVKVNNPYKVRNVKFTVKLPKSFKQKHYVEILDANNKVIWTSSTVKTGSSSYNFTYQLDTSSTSFSRKIRIRTVSGNKKYDSSLFKINSSTINKNVTATFATGTSSNTLKAGKIVQK